MGFVKTTITLKNAADVSAVERGYITESQIRALTLNALVDTGAWTLVINEDTREKLGLRTTGQRPGTLADGTSVVCYTTEGVEVHWKNRDTVCTALVIPDSYEILLGAIPLEGMDLMIHPNKEELVGVHGDAIVGRV
jgi:clan AA aspartic protease